MIHHDVWLSQESFDDRMKADLDELKKISSLHVPAEPKKFGAQTSDLGLIRSPVFYSSLPRSWTLSAPERSDLTTIGVVF